MQQLDCRSVAFSNTCCHKSPRSGPGDFDIDPQIFVGQGRGDAVGPFDDCDGVSAESLVHDQLAKFVLVVQAVGVEMIDCPLAAVLLDQNKCRTDDVLTGKPTGGGDSLPPP